MHFTPLTLCLLGSLTLTLTRADNDADLGYMKCVSAVVKTTSFPSCTSSYKLDCFCEAQAQSQKQGEIDENGNANVGFPGVSKPTRAQVQLSPEVEEFCAENGIPKDEIAKYLCDDTAVPISPRRGSAPMVRFEAGGHDIPSSALHRDESEDDEKDDEKEVDENDTMTSKRAIQPEMTRLLIPENGDETSTPNTETDETQSPEGANQEGSKEGEDHLATANAVYQVVTITETRTMCSCATPTPSVAEDETEESEEKTSGAMHGTEVGVLTTMSEPEAPSSASASVHVASSSVVGAKAVPTGVDAEQHSLKNGEGEDKVEDEDKDADDDEAELFEGGAVSYGVSRSVIVGVLSIIAGFAL
ncbi:hypothetical protein BDV12DRAFT_194857 [Aspergillus spectabilis]